MCPVVCVDGGRSKIGGGELALPSELEGFDIGLRPCDVFGGEAGARPIIESMVPVLLGDTIEPDIDPFLGDMNPFAEEGVYDEAGASN